MKRASRMAVEGVGLPEPGGAYFGEPGDRVVARIVGNITAGGLVANYCDCSTCACGSCSCNCSCGACGACYCDCNCKGNILDLQWRAEDLVSFARMMEAMNLRIGEMEKIIEATRR